MIIAICIIIFLSAILHIVQLDLSDDPYKTIKTACSVLATLCAIYLANTMAAPIILVCNMGIDAFFIGISVGIHNVQTKNNDGVSTIVGLKLLLTLAQVVLVTVYIATLQGF